MNTFLMTILTVGIVGFALSRAGADTSFGEKLAAAALMRTSQDVVYDGRYVKLAYPGGDVPGSIGVCSDVIIRSYRTLGIDLQKNVHEDMVSAFHSYPDYWGPKKPDSNIDHRRVPNLRQFFTRQGEVLPISDRKDDYKAGDIVTWNLKPGGNLPHIGIVSDKTSRSGAPMIIHNIGQGPKLEDMLFSYKITGHYRYTGS